MSTCIGRIGEWQGIVDVIGIEPLIDKQGGFIIKKFSESKQQLFAVGGHYPSFIR